MRRLQPVRSGVPGGWLHHAWIASILGGHSNPGSSARRSSMSTLIRNGTVVTAESTFTADILVEGEKIKEVRPGIPVNAADRVLDATGLLLLPGGIDAHTHLDMPFGGTTSSDDFETGTRAAAFGGTTTIVDFAIQAPRHAHARRSGYLVEEGRRQSLYRLRAAHDRHRSRRTPVSKTWTTWWREGVASFKLFMAYPNVLMVDDATIFRALVAAPRRTARSSACTPRTAA